VCNEKRSTFRFLALTVVFKGVIASILLNHLGVTSNSTIGCERKFIDSRKVKMNSSEVNVFFFIKVYILFEVGEYIGWNSAKL
jgi:hypothetical protein